jgi:phosphomethylpyrimidine synthase
MKITQDVRDYAATLNEAQVELAQETTVVDPDAMVSDPLASPASSGTGLTPSLDREAGMAQMSQKFRDMGGQVYVDADKVKKSNEALG